MLFWLVTGEPGLNLALEADDSAMKRERCGRFPGPPRGPSSGLLDPQLMMRSMHACRENQLSELEEMWKIKWKLQKSKVILTLYETESGGLEQTSVTISTTQQASHSYLRHPPFHRFLLFSDDKGYILYPQIGDRLDLICPASDPPGPRAPAEYEFYKLYLVSSRDQADRCEVTGAPNLLLTCDKPTSDMRFTIKFQEYSPNLWGHEFKTNHDYFIIGLNLGVTWHTHTRTHTHTHTHAHMLQSLSLLQQPQRIDRQAVPVSPQIQASLYLSDSRDAHTHTMLSVSLKDLGYLTLGFLSAWHCRGSGHRQMANSHKAGIVPPSAVEPLVEGCVSLEQGDRLSSAHRAIDP
ncbi:hypothetical protein DNTS_032183 [Danionella cerebrum]|uniref:Ephrin RBD domain-containing protein n=1 Tax=Danionella cerebrum TaxID=2873325 RepID=A0A553MWP9_9TELE|nr:hypothetical protein DNTS_032183 [Danionella translucida]